jgi:hypothetical protein
VIERDAKRQEQKSGTGRYKTRRKPGNAEQQSRTTERWQTSDRERCRKLHIAQTSKRHRSMQSDAENNESRATRHDASSRVEGRCADDGYNEIDSDAEIPAEQHSINNQSDRERCEETGAEERDRPIQNTTKAGQCSAAEQNNRALTGKRQRVMQKIAHSADEQTT